jgi:diguanylate cyclase (GGDEF)-like protein
MELKAYWRILRRRWWLVLLGFAAVFGLTWVLSSRQPPIYEASTTFVIRPRASESSVGEEFVRALDIVSRRVEINTTFAEVATSRLIKKQAVERLGLSSAEQQDLKVNARVVGGTNVMEISVEGRDPAVTRDFANAVGAETVAYVGQLYDVFELEPLDEANLPRTPSRPNVAVNLAMGSVLGLALGASLVFVLQYLETTAVERESFNIIERETGAYTRSYLLHRLWGEVSRARRSKRPLSLGLIRMEFDGEPSAHNTRDHAEVMRLTKATVERSLREEDVLARFDADTFAVLLPDTSGQQAQNLLKKTITRVRSMPHYAELRKYASEVRPMLGVATYVDFRVEPERFLDDAIKSLGAPGLALSPAERANGKAQNGTVRVQEPEEDDELYDLVEADLVEE